MRKYYKGIDRTFDKGSRHVFVYQNEAHFMCPCGERLVKVIPSIHSIEFDEQGIMTIDPSCGSKEMYYGIPPNRIKAPKGWCHFYIKNGLPEICEDSQCPGKDL